MTTELECEKAHKYIDIFAVGVPEPIRMRLYAAYRAGIAAERRYRNEQQKPEQLFLWNN